MKALRNFMNKIKPHFQQGGKFSKLESVFDGMETFLFTPNTTSRSGVHIHDSNDMKRTMITVVVALLPCLLFAMYNIGYQHFRAIGMPDASFVQMFIFGLLAMLPVIVVSYVVGLGIEFIGAQIHHKEIQEGFLVTGILIPLIVPINTPLWMTAVATAFAVIFAKEIFGGTGMNIFNVALITRAFLFFSYPSSMTGDDSVWVSQDVICGLGYAVPDTFSAATPLGEIAAGMAAPTTSLCDQIYGLIPGSIGETSVIAIALGACLLLWTGVASWKTMLSVFVGGALTGWMYNALGLSTLDACQHIVLGGFCFGAVFMATDPVTSARTEGGKWIYGFMIGFVAVTVRVLNPGYPEGMMLAILLMNLFAPLIDYCFVSRNISRRAKRLTSK